MGLDYFLLWGCCLLGLFFVAAGMISYRAFHSMDAKPEDQPADKS